MSKEEIKEQLQKVERINKTGRGQMYGLAVCDMLARENKKIEKRGEELGKKNGIIQVAQNLINMKVSPEQIKKATGLTDEELKELEGRM